MTKRTKHNAAARAAAGTKADKSIVQSDQPTEAEEVSARPRGAAWWAKRVAFVLAALIAVCAVSFLSYTGVYYHAADAAQEAVLELESGDLRSADGQQITYSETDAGIAVGPEDAEHGLVFYPGAKVEAAAYVPLAQKFAEEGIYCVIAKMPFNLAILKADAAGELMDAAPQVKTWWIGGHSLGGVMAADYALGHASEIEGVVLAGSYTTKDFNGTGLELLIAYGSEDGVMNRDSLEATVAAAPEGSETLVIEGGNHANFGDYGTQDEDGEATITADEQQEQLVQAFMRITE